VTWHQFLHDLAVVLWDATWGNNVAAIEWAAALAVLGLLGRRRIGRGLAASAEAIGPHVAAWWARHHGPYAVEHHKQALREHAAERRERGDERD
jgi:hypothetical protein